MPWLVKGKCVHKEKSDGSAGELVKCHETEEQAKKHARALYANVEDSVFAEFSMRIDKTRIAKDGTITWRSVNSDINEDYYGEKMSKDLFKDFISHIENEDEIPEPFKSKICEADWCGGMPYISIAHYKSGTNRVNVPGEPTSIYMDGDALKSKGILYDTPLGKAVYKSLEKDAKENLENKIRISIGFLDLEHSHGDKFVFTRKALGEKCPLCAEGIGDKIYKKGHLVHLALTRVPANPRTDMELEMKSKLEDAKSIVEDEEVLKDLELKSTAEEALVVKAEEPVDEPVVELAKEMDCEDDDEDCKKKMADKKKDMENKSVVENTVHPPVVASTTDPRGYKEIEPSAEPTPIEKSFAALVERVAMLKSQGLTGENALKEIQPVFEEIGNVIKAEFEPTPQELANTNLEATLRSLTEQVTNLVQIVAPMQSELAELRALSLTKQPTKIKEEIPQPRSLNVNLVQKAAIDSLVAKTKAGSFADIAQRSVGL